MGRPPEAAGGDRWDQHVEAGEGEQRAEGGESRPSLAFLGAGCGGGNVEPHGGEGERRGESPHNKHEPLPPAPPNRLAAASGHARIRFIHAGDVPVQACGTVPARTHPPPQKPRNSPLHTSTWRHERRPPLPPSPEAKFCFVVDIVKSYLTPGRPTRIHAPRRRSTPDGARACGPQCAEARGGGGAAGAAQPQTRGPATTTPPRLPVAVRRRDQHME